MLAVCRSAILIISACVTASPLLAKENSAGRYFPLTSYVLPPIGHTFFCQEYPSQCFDTKAADGFEIRSKNMLYRNVEAVNRSINQEIIPSNAASTDVVGNRWLLQPPVGNCHDFAVTKRYRLMQMGWPSSALLLAEVSLRTGVHHLVLVVDIRGDKFVLDNLNPKIIPLGDDDNYSWLRMESSRYAGRWLAMTLRS